MGTVRSYLSVHCINKTELTFGLSKTVGAAQIPTLFYEEETSHLTFQISLVSLFHRPQRSGNSNVSLSRMLKGESQCNEYKLILPHQVKTLYFSKDGGNKNLSNRKVNLSVGDNLDIN